MPSQENFFYKKITHVAQERFTIQNMAYTQIFIDYLHTKDPYTLKYFDECGVKLPTDGSRHYGHAPVGNRAVEIKRYCQTANTTVNLMCSLTGVTYMNIIDGPSNTFEFLNFFKEAYRCGTSFVIRLLNSSNEKFSNSSCSIYTGVTRLVE